MRECAIGDNDLRVLLWNVSRTNWDVERIGSVAAALQAHDADVIGIVEAGPDSAGHVARWRRELPDYETVMPQQHMAVPLRGKVERFSTGELVGGFDQKHVLVHVSRHGRVADRYVTAVRPPW